MFDVMVLIRQLQGRFGGAGFHGPYSAASGSLAIGANASLLVTHDLGLTSGSYTLVGSNEIGANGEDINVGWVHTSTDSVTVWFRNVGNRGNASVTYRFWIVASA